MYILNKVVIGSLGIVASIDIASRAIEKMMGQFDIDIQKPIDTVSIIIPSYNEERTVALAAVSIREQSAIQEYPEYFETILVDSGSTDKTVELAKPFVDKVIIAPRGKLTARNIATVRAKGNIIVSVDSDSYYPYNWLNTLLKPFSDQSIAGVLGSTLDYSIPNLPGQVHTVAYNIFDRMIMHPKQMPGRNCAYYKHLFYLLGRFNETVNQFDLNSMLAEEEIDFGDRLSKLGKIVFKLNAPCIHLGGGKVACRFGLESRESCKRYGIGIDRF